ncbi:eRF1 Peptide chain release factor 1 eRF1 [Pyrenophora tritici-repentis]|uniref:ERF1, Peptide chain release factor 1 (ERF1) n=1 Tax=Pyrenophora tritici-repentis TaxID=45151 RepID=A0A2W1ELS2_9PLEO|nr:Eukaryotic peptide chain release factor subunit 1 [Pyrenophora tritici-repentis]KAF7454036.1 Eukaryotic peptide chain release factor protein [Pyrenophora tritici-repentis]KAF7577125.1 eRF1, Peptide chain release factor 1 (eRF1) [Pyrenophora tritici-repentis]KAG9387780.1 Eukaryotic peptide chain release factor protein [Pyrenophora tritici-repentis]KAI1542242.1 eRF1 Peptide chain release factor 1 eRF1 [Pyrenophora tritici-repentis]
MSSGKNEQPNEAEKNIEIWKVKKLIKRLEAARGNGTSMISLIIPPKDQVSRAAKMLAEEFVRRHALRLYGCKCRRSPLS